jgi:hypothetical protein
MSAHVTHPLIPFDLWAITFQLQTCAEKPKLARHMKVSALPELPLQNAFGEVEGFAMISIQICLPRCSSVSIGFSEEV